MSIIRVMFGFICFGGIFVLAIFIGGFHIETSGVLRCRKRHPRYGTRCALKSNGHFGVWHRDRQGRAWP